MATHRINAVWARQVVELLEARGRPSAIILREVGLDRRRVFEPNGRIPFSKHAALMESAAHHLADPHFGFRFGSNLDPRDAGAVAYLAANSPNLGAALSNFITYMRTLNEALRAIIENQAQVAVLSLEIKDSSASGMHHAQCSIICGALKIARFLLGRRIYPDWVEVAHPQDALPAEFQRYFGCPVTFGAERNAIVFKASDLDRPCCNSDPRLLHILKAHCDEQLVKIGSEADLKERVKSLIVQGLAAGTATSQSVARDLGLSNRSFARRLAEQDTTFGKLLAQVRRQLAERYLADPSVKTAQVAFMLGYAEPAAFTNAFRRWTGKTPSAFRASRCSAEHR
ncbi:MAG: AraC family transcriptional regulator [Pseudomonadota bacterium]